MGARGGVVTHLLARLELNPPSLPEPGVGQWHFLIGSTFAPPEVPEMLDFAEISGTQASPNEVFGLSLRTAALLTWSCDCSKFGEGS